MEADAAVEGHPVGDRRAVSLPLQRGISLLVGEGEGPRRGRPSPGGVAGDEIRLHQQLPVLVEEQVLGRQIDLHVGIPVVILPVAGALLGVHRLPLPALPGLNHGHQGGFLLPLVDSPAVVAPADGHRGAVGGLQALGPVGRVVLGGQRLHILRRPLLGDRHLAAVVGEPLADGLPVQHLRLVPEGVGDGHPGQAVVLRQQGFQILILRRDGGLRVDPRLLQGQFRPQAGDRVPHRRVQLLRVRRISLDLLHDGVAAARGVIRDPGVLRLLRLLCVQALQAGNRLG